MEVQQFADELTESVATALIVQVVGPRDTATPGRMCKRCGAPLSRLTMRRAASATVAGTAKGRMFTPSA